MTKGIQIRIADSTVLIPENRQSFHSIFSFWQQGHQAPVKRDITICFSRILRSREIMR